MEKTYMKEGRFIPAAAPATEAERLWAIENFLIRFSEENEYTLTRLGEQLSGLSVAAEQNREVV